MSISFRDIKADVLERLSTGAWRPGELLPTEADLARTYDCARATVNRALRELADEGYLDRRRKSGTRVRMAPVRQARFDIPLTRAEIEAQGARYRYSLIEREERPAPEWLAARLALAQDTPILHLVCLHHADGHPYQHEDRWISLAALPAARGVDFAATGPNEWLVATVPFSDVEIGLSAVSADAAMAARLGCATGDPLLRMDRATWLGGMPVTLVHLCYQRGHRMATRY